MYYLKCNHCGHLNPLRSEYVTFCESCSKKMDNGFSDWKKKHPAGTFQEYSEAVGTSSTTADAAAKVSKKKISRQKITIIVTVVVAVAIGSAFNMLGDDLVKRFLPQRHVKKEWVTSQWETFRTPHGILQIDLPPAGMHPYTLPLPEHIRPMVTLMESSSSDSSLPININVHEFEYIENITPSLKGAATGSVNQVQQSPGVTDFEHLQRDTVVGGQPAVIQQGTYKKDRERFCFTNFVVSKAQRVAGVTIIFRSNDKNGDAVACRIISTVKLKNI